VIFSDALNHASIIDGIRLSRARKVIYPHGDLNFLEDTLRWHSKTGRSRVIVTESIFSMDGDRAPSASCSNSVKDTARKSSWTKLTRPAHAAHADEGWWPHSTHRTALAVVLLAGKALASAGAFICGSKTLKQFLINHARSFIFTQHCRPIWPFRSGPLYSWRIRWRPNAIIWRSLSARLRERLCSLGFDCGPSGSHIVPLIIGGNEAALDLAAALQARGFGRSSYSFSPVSLRERAPAPLAYGPADHGRNREITDTVLAILSQHRP